jgi:hypothetical protein
MCCQKSQNIAKKFWSVRRTKISTPALNIIIIIIIMLLELPVADSKVALTFSYIPEGIYQSLD